MEEGLRRFRRAHAAFPQSPVIATLIGELHKRREQWLDALAMYDLTLAIVPTHRDALLGRAVSLSRLSRHEEAVTAATHLIDLGSWFLAEAYYWRGWNEYQLNRLQDARADADRAKAMATYPDTYVLSGIIEWREQRRESAETEFQAALQLDFGHCEAAFLLGGVRSELRKWPESMASFQHARQCFATSISLRREAVAKLAADPRNAPEIASHERAIADAEKRRGQSEQNIATLKKLMNVTVE
jgi:tetratricopeptide (TPR) repeat protein